MSEVEHGVEQSFPLTDIAVFVPCANDGAGENVTWSGELHGVVKFTIRGDRVSGVYHFNAQGVQALGETTGNTYQGVATDNTNFHSQLEDDGHQTFSFTLNYKAIGRGREANFSVHQVCHVTQNAAGDFTASTGNIRVECV